MQYEFDSSIHILNYDSDKCKIVLSNFLMNALKYSGASDRVLIKTAFIEEKMAVRVSVIDESTGLKILILQNSLLFFLSRQSLGKRKWIGVSLFKVADGFAERLHRVSRE